MKRIIKGLSIFIFVVLILGFCPKNVKAVDQSDYLSINESNKEFAIKNLAFSNLTFKDYSNTSVQAFGVSGVVNNSLDQDLYYTFLVRYCDLALNKIIAQQQISLTIKPGSNVFNIMSNLDILKGNNAKLSDIAYYKILIKEESKDEFQELTKPSRNNTYQSYDYVIDKYDININVNENNTLDITESIQAYFKTPKHGIYRTIPLKNKIVRLDGSTTSNRAQISNVLVSETSTASMEDNIYKLQIGEADKTLMGEHDYVIKYTYNLGKDRQKDYDELYFNIIGDEWDTVIGNITFTITMPKDFDVSKLGFSSGQTGSTDNSKVKYNVQNNIISGSYNGVLNEKEALTIRCELDEGYFVNAGLTINPSDYIAFLIPLLFLAVALFIWSIYGRDEQVVETIEFYPPEGFNSLEVGYLYKGKADNTDVTSLLIYLANKGYIKITEIDEKTLFSTSKSFKITKLKDYDGNNINEKIFLEGLFSCRRIEYDDKDVIEVTKSDLYNEFYLTMSKILKNINTKENKNKLFERKASSKSIFIILMIIATYILITIVPLISKGNSSYFYLDISSLVIALVFPGLGFSLTMAGMFSDNNTISVNGVRFNSKIAAKVFLLIWGLLFGGIPWVIFVLPTLRQDPLYLIGYLVGIGCVAGMIICIKFLPKRTKYGNEILGKIKGFKNFLEVAEKEKLEAMVLQDPTYFYDILPFTYVLGVSNKWIKKFESISLKAPDWYDSPSTFDMITFQTFMTSTMSSAQSAMASSPSSSSSGGGFSSGGSSGGGSSGGGSGGGGGGSW